MFAPFTKFAILALVLTGMIETTPAQTIRVNIDAARTSAPISKYVYGQFVEHIGNIINSGIWAEMLDDRKFYNPIPTPKPKQEDRSRFGRNRMRSWSVVGPTDAIQMDTAHPYVGKQSPRILLAAEPRGIEQSGIEVLAGKAYAGRIVLKGDSHATVSVSLVWGDASTERATVKFSKLRDGFETFKFRLETPVSSEKARLEIAGTGSGSFSIGAVSLMPADNVDGFRKEVVDVLKELRSGVYRFPGGNFVSAHEWRDAVGDLDKRAPKYDPVWHAVQPNDVGTDEFIKFCKHIGVEPYVAVSAGFGDAWSARELVEYCNGAASTPMGQWRAKNGYSKPYGVKYWGIGNETWGFSYQFGAMRLNQYVYKHNDFAEAMRKVDPTIQLIGCGAMADTMTGSGESLNLGDSLIPKPLGPADWTGGLFLHCLDNMELISEHFYNYSETHYDLAKGKQVPNAKDEPLVDWMRRPANHIRLKYEEYKEYETLIPALKKKPVPICLDEWAYAGGPANSFKVAPALAWSFHEMFRHSDLYQMACFTFATSMYSASHGKAVLNPIGITFKLYRDHFGVLPVEVTGNSPQPKPTDPVGGEQPAVNAGSDTFPVDVTAAWTEDRKTLTIAVINPTETEQTISLALTNANLSGKGKLYRLAPESLLSVTDVSGKTEVKVEEVPFTSMGETITLPKHSISIYRIDAN